MQGTTSGLTRAGPGHLAASVLPGQPGNSVIIGRQTSYGGPFKRLASLHAGDRDPRHDRTGHGALRRLRGTQPAGTPKRCCPRPRAPDSRHVGSGRCSRTAIASRTRGSRARRSRRPATCRRSPRGPRSHRRPDRGGDTVRVVVRRRVGRWPSSRWRHLRAARGSSSCRSCSPRVGSCSRTSRVAPGVSVTASGRARARGCERCGDSSIESRPMFTASLREACRRARPVIRPVRCTCPAGTPDGHANRRQLPC